RAAAGEGWLHEQVRCSLLSGVAELEEAAWAAIAAGAAAGGALAAVPLGAAGACPVGRLVSAALSPQGRAAWSEALARRSVPGVALALAATAACGGTVASVLPPEAELPAVVAACAAGVSQCAPGELRDASCLALVTLLTSAAYSHTSRAQALHRGACLRKAFEAVAGAHEEPSAQAAEEDWATSPVLLYLLLVIRAGPRWLDLGQLSQHACSLARLARAPRGSGPRRLLALRVLEAVAEAGGAALPCQRAVLQQAVGDGSAWAAAEAEMAEVAAAQRLHLAEDTAADLLQQLRARVAERLCAALGS
ncbi:unnamed protein product, partial [Prorocentrum cordatum]